MLRNNLVIILRNLIRNKTFSLINILGLSIGLVTFLAISLYVVDELSFDRFHASGAAAIITAWITVSYQSIKAAIANPVKSLRSE